MIQTMARLNQQLVLLCSAGTVIYRPFCRVSTCFLQYLVTARISTNAHISFLLAHPDLHERYCQDLDSEPELVASQDKRVRQTPRGGVITGKDARTHLRVEAQNVYTFRRLGCGLTSAHTDATRGSPIAHMYGHENGPRRGPGERVDPSTCTHAHTHCIE